jgi:hypothetical protein
VEKLKVRVKRERNQGMQARQRAFRLTNRKDDAATERKKCRIVDASSSESLVEEVKGDHHRCATFYRAQEEEIR